jgi:hypothetical protein
MSHIVKTIRGSLVMHASYVLVTYVISDILTQISRGCILWLQCGGKFGKATSLCFHFSIVSMDKCKSWLSSNRTSTGFSFEKFGVCYEDFYISYKMILHRLLLWMDRVLTLSKPIFLPTAYSPALISFGR